MPVRNYKTVCHKKITEFFAANPDKLVKAADIDAYLKKKGIEVNISTIYRYLNKLSMDGTVLKYAAGKGEMSAFQYVGDRGQSCREHLHLHCVGCGKIIHLKCDFMKEISEHINEHHGFTLICESSVLYGLCRECREEL